MDIFQILKKDHQTVKDLFKKLETTGPRAMKSREKLFSQLKDDLEAHSHGEEAVFYPALRENAEMVDLINEATEEHAEVENLLEDLEAMGAQLADQAIAISENPNKRPEVEPLGAVKFAVNKRIANHLNVSISAQDERSFDLILGER